MAGSCPDDGDVRRHDGILEIYHMGSWRSVCDDPPNDSPNVAHVALVACRQLGFSMGTALIGQPCIINDFWLDDLVCTGAETSIAACMHRPWGVHDCILNECIRLTCSN